MAILAMNIGRKPFDDVNVRKAISMAINREQVVMIGEAGVVAANDVDRAYEFLQVLESC